MQRRVLIFARGDYDHTHRSLLLCRDSGIGFNETGAGQMLKRE